MAERLQKVLARAGVASRRKSEELIRADRVKVNGVVVTEMGTRVDPAADRITVDGRAISAPDPFIYIMLHKPRGYISSVRDERGRPTVLSLVSSRQRVYPAGRLDFDSEGLILLTNDGALTQRLTHPRYEHEKEYRVLVQGYPSRGALRTLRQGVVLEDGQARVDDVALLRGSNEESWLRVIIHEGRNHLVRRMCQAIGHPVLRLIRVRIGPLELGKLSAGKHRHLTGDEVKQLKRMTTSR